MTGDPVKKLDSPVATALQGIIRMIERSNGQLTPELLDNIRSSARSAIELLKANADPFAEKIGFIILALRQSTSVTTRVVNGRRLTRVTILDKVIYEWALEQLHTLYEAA